MRESEYLCISFNSPGTRQTSLPQPSVQDRITHILWSLEKLSATVPEQQDSDTLPEHQDADPAPQTKDTGE
jgi:hypothetical protein